LKKSALPKPPTHLGKHGKAAWTSLQREYGIGDAGGLHLLGVVADAVDRMREAQAVLAKDGALIHDRYGCPKAHPALKVENDARSGMLTALKMLNLDLEPVKPIGRPAGSFNFGTGRTPYANE
jgi:P27 family predicted phage terminase small subunit